MAITVETGEITKYATGEVLDRPMCVTTDHKVDTFIVSVRSSGGVSADRLKAVIQEQHEVTEIHHARSETIIRQAKPLSSLERGRHAGQFGY